MNLINHFSQNGIMIWVYMLLIAGVFWAWGISLYKILSEFLPPMKKEITKS